MIIQYAAHALLRSPRRLLTGVFGTLLAIGLLSSVLLFVGASARDMTQRTLVNVPVDLRAEALNYDLDLSAIRKTLLEQKGIVDAQFLTRANLNASSFTRDQKTFTTGAVAILAIEPSYLSAFPAIRIAQGQFDPTGILLNPDMATNLAARVGDTINLQVANGSQLQLKVTGIADLHNADPLFAPTDPRAQAAGFNPPMNVVVMPLALFDAQFFPQLKDAPVSADANTPGTLSAVVNSNGLPVQHQIHLKVDRTALAGDPTLAQLQSAQLRLGLEKLYPNQLRVSDELSAAIEMVKSDVLWAQILFVFIAIPGILLAGYLSLYTAQALLQDQQREFSLLRARGASNRQVLSIVAVMSIAIGLVGSLVGLLLSSITIAALFGIQVFALDNWRLWGTTLLSSLLVGLFISTVSTLFPARHLLRSEVISAQAAVPRVRTLLWSRLYLDFGALVIAVLVFWVTRVNGFHPVLNAEGNVTLSLSFYTFLAPLLFWIGAALLLLRIARVMLRKFSQGLGEVLRVFFGEVGSYAAVASARRADAMSSALMVIALALSFGYAISIFSSTYLHQQRVDAELTLGSDIKVTPTRGHLQTDAFTSTLAQIPGVGAATPFKATIAYVGTEIQDIFGIDVATFRRATNVSDAFFRDATAAETLDRLAATPDGILISDEMARDYSIVNGDHITIRIFNNVSETYQDAHFTVIGVALEFPTAPKDAFLVVNQPALVKATGEPNINSFLLKTNGETASVAQTVRARVSSDVAQVESSGAVAAKLATSLTSLNLTGLVTIEFGYTVLISSLGLAVFLVALLAARRREFATMRALGATGRQVSAFVIAEAGIIGTSGLLVGALIGFGLASMLVLILEGIFDPPPTGPIVDFAPLLLLGGLSLLGMVLAIVFALLQIQRSHASVALREVSLNVRGK